MLDRDIERGKLYRHPLKGEQVLLSNSQAGQGINFSQPRAHLKTKIKMKVLPRDVIICTCSNGIESSDWFILNLN